LILSDLLSDLLSLLQRFMNISQSVHILQSKPSGTMLRVDQLVKLDPDTSLATWEKKNKKQKKKKTFPGSQSVSPRKSRFHSFLAQRSKYRQAPAQACSVVELKSVLDAIAKQSPFILCLNGQTYTCIISLYCENDNI